MWEHEYNSENDETTIYYNGVEKATFGGKITRWKNGIPDDATAKNAIRDVLKNSNESDAIVMLFDLALGMDKREP